MKDITKLIRRFVGILLLSTVLVIVLNIIILAAISASQTANGRPWTTAKETAEALQKTETGYILSGDMTERLSGENAWAIYIDNDTLEVKWHTENLPDTVPLHYTISDIASLTRGYIDGYPTYTGECENGLVVVGYPKDRYWKHMSPSWDYDFIKNAPYTVLIVIGVNVFLIFLIYMIANSKLLKSVKPITNGIQALPSGEPVYVKEKGLLSDLAAKINQTSDILQKQKRNLQRKETARANWISGVSHDIRTPLSMVMGYAGQIEDNESLPESERKKARIIRQQSTKMKNLINDLNLASKLEYNMQPIHPEPVNLVAIARQSVVDFINLDMEEKYPIDKKRIYAVGHSNGGRMTQRLSRTMPERFAAFGPTGALGGKSADAIEPIDDHMKCPIAFMMVEYDMASPSVEEGSIARETLKAYCRANHMTPQFENWYDNGIYHTLVMYDKDHVPMIRYTIMKGCPHTYTGEMAQLTWDTFLCHFTREADGSIQYHG